MSIEIFVPDIGDDEVEVTEISVQIGDTVAEEDTLLTVEGDKASMEVPAPQAGVVQEIRVNIGDTVKTGSLVFIFAAEASAAAPVAEAEVVVEAAPVAAAAAQVLDVNIPDIGDDEVEVTEISVNVGDTVAEEDTLMTVEGDKASMEVPAPFAGVVKEIKVNVGDNVKTGSFIMTFEVAGAGAAPAVVAVAAPVAAAKVEAPKAAPAAAKAPEVTGFVENDAYHHASPVVRRLAREFGVNLDKVGATGRKGRIAKEDVQTYVKNAVKRLESGATGGNGSGMDVLAWPKVDFAKFGEIEVVKMTRIQKISGPNLHRNWVKIPHVTQFDEADITELEAFRKVENNKLVKQDKGFKISPLIFIVKAVAKALADYPKFNTSIGEDGATIIQKKYINIGVAVDTPNGLVVPVIRNVDQKGIYELSQDLAVISKKARSGKLTSSDMQGGCFTISSLGGIGGTQFTPIVNAPEVAILGVSRSEIKPKWDGKDFAPRLMLPMALSYDHRVIDGADGARFVTALNGYLSDLRKLVL
ncbi:Dihydrolipoamide acetyltransferase component of pyruvate dehydrogenase complex [Moritella sp. JT01]|uniref:pyruvate dehydrogenase complex dihydrolipoyllysine-residue acetyltransferase n=1 Tax=Moritella sp. JT01 TaxID=756698 RepID=UPI0007946986|nr:pyruvate dehydrogenase complex dihydrolipoyllysine-residue acetyltransferase [Moritella sp. JT01]KXO11193.1 Dihydrolipoamide acetyltransferase component of pyruvate dehydrogenase complex [Moritella sp. JT01]